MCESVSLETAKCNSAPAAERDGFVKCFERAIAHYPAGVDTITTDGNVSIRAYMKRSGMGVTHALDVWHICKNLGKNLGKQVTRKVGFWLHQWFVWTIHFTCVEKFSQSYHLTDSIKADVALKQFL